MCIPYKRLTDAYYKMADNGVKTTKPAKLYIVAAAAAVHSCTSSSPA